MIGDWLLNYCELESNSKVSKPAKTDGESNRFHDGNSAQTFAGPSMKYWKKRLNGEQWRLITVRLYYIVSTYIITVREYRNAR